MKIVADCISVGCHSSGDFRELKFVFLSTLETLVDDADIVLSSGGRCSPY